MADKLTKVFVTAIMNAVGDVIIGSRSGSQQEYTQSCWRNELWNGFTVLSDCLSEWVFDIKTGEDTFYYIFFKVSLWCLYCVIHSKLNSFIFNFLIEFKNGLLCFPPPCRSWAMNFSF